MPIRVKKSGTYQQNTFNIDKARVSLLLPEFNSLNITKNAF